MGCTFSLHFKNANCKMNALYDHAKLICYMLWKNHYTALERKRPGYQYFLSCLISQLRCKQVVCSGNIACIAMQAVLCVRLCTNLQELEHLLLADLGAFAAHDNKEGPLCPFGMRNTYHSCFLHLHCGIEPKRCTVKNKKISGSLQG